MKKLTWILLVLIILNRSGYAQFGITIDAQRDTYWNTLTGPDDGYIRIPPNALAIGTSVDNDEDLSALIWLGWDQDYLYCYAEVADNLILVNNATAYENDAVELKIDPDPTMQVTTGVVGWRLSAWGTDMADDTSGVDNLNSNESGADPAWVAVEGEDYARTEVETDDRYGYNLEFRLPWDAITPLDQAKVVDVSEGGIFGLAINVMDNDDISRTEVIQWSAGLNDACWNNAQLHGTVTLLADGKLELVPVNSAGGPAAVSDPDWYIPPAQSGAGSESRIVANFMLEQNYPNPFNPSTTINFSVQNSGIVKLAIFDILGQEIRTLVDKTLSEGCYSTVWDGRDNTGAMVSSGIYFYRVDAGTFTASRKLTLIQ